MLTGGFGGNGVSFNGGAPMPASQASLLGMTSNALAMPQQPAGIQSGNLLAGGVQNGSQQPGLQTGSQITAPQVTQGSFSNGGLNPNPGNLGVGNNSNFAQMLMHLIGQRGQNYGMGNNNQGQNSQAFGNLTGPSNALNFGQNGVYSGG